VLELTELPDAVRRLVNDGDSIALEGVSHLIPTAAGHELIRQQRKALVLLRMTPDVVGDQLIGMGCVRELGFGWSGNPGVGSLHRFRDAVEKDWPRPLRLNEHSHAGMAEAYRAGAANLPFGVLRGYSGGDLEELAPSVKRVVCPFTGEPLAAVRALRPDVAVIHAQEADRAGNIHLWGIVGVQKEAVLSARRSLVTVERVVDRFTPRPGSVVLPSWAVTAVSLVPGGAHPSYAQDIYGRDDGFYAQWEKLSRDRTTFQSWMERCVLGVSDVEGYRRAVAAS
jgi:glutaconate CoA-transferase subunit A